MAEELVTFTIDGSAAKNGAIPADVFTAKLNAFIAMIYAFERAFTRREKRQLDLEITVLEKNSPGQVGMRPRSKQNGYDPQPALVWSFRQLEAIGVGRPVDVSVGQVALDNVIDLALVRESRAAELGVMSAHYGGRSVALDESLAAHALVLRDRKAISAAPVWRAGVSRGTVFGELRGVMDVDGERQIYIVPPTGPARIQCVFPEDLRPLIQDNLFKAVRAKGYLHYDGRTPFPHLLNADSLEGVVVPTEHFSDLRGLFSQPETRETLAL